MGFLAADLIASIYKIAVKCEINKESLTWRCEYLIVSNSR